jgi:hypothetical protein
MKKREIDWIKCPVCGKNARPDAIGRAGTHLVTGLKGVSLGYRKIQLKRVELRLEWLEALEKCLEKALAQVRTMIERVRVLLVKKEVLLCPVKTRTIENKTKTVSSVNLSSAMTQRQRIMSSDLVESVRLDISRRQRVIFKSAA